MSLPDKNILSWHVPIVQSASKQGVPDNCWYSRQGTGWHCDYQNFRQIVGGISALLKNILKEFLYKLYFCC